LYTILYIGKYLTVCDPHEIIIFGIFQFYFECGEPLGDFTLKRYNRKLTLKNKMHLAAGTPLEYFPKSIYICLRGSNRLKFENFNLVEVGQNALFYLRTFF
jgi:hypothetical protein